MSDIFISYARSTAVHAQQVADALRAMGYGVWRDDELPAHRAYADVIEERLTSAKAVVVIWSAEAARSEWVRSEAERARADRKLVQLTVDNARLPMPFDQIQCADLNGWAGDADSPGWVKVLASVAALTSGAPTPNTHIEPAARKLAICVLPFVNMSGDAEQEYFSDGISEDIITDLSKVSSMFVVARNTAFQFKGKSLDVAQIARQLGVSHVLEGSVRKAGGRVRITAQLIDGATGGHTWAERWDRDLTDIFALQDEISQAIVGALRLKLLPEEKKAIERRGTDNAEAYDLYLMARQQWVSGNIGDPRRPEAIIRLLQRTTEIDPAYAQAWALLGSAQTLLGFEFGLRDVDGSAAIERALSLDPNLADAHASKAIQLRNSGRPEEAWAEAEIALRLDPESYDANRAAARLCYLGHRFEDAIRYWEKSAAAVEADFASPALLMTCYTALGDRAGARRAAEMTLKRAEMALAQDRNNSSALGFGAGSLAVMGERERAREWSRRALLIDPDNLVTRYNLGCALSIHLEDADGAIELLGPYFTRGIRADLEYAKTDPDLDPIRDDPRFAAMVAEAEARLASG
jgi:adenylate cyclase